MHGSELQVHGVAKSRNRLSYFPITFHFHALEKVMAPHSSVLAWRIPATGEPGGLPSMGSHRVRHDWSDLAAARKEKSFLSSSGWKIIKKEWQLLYDGKENVWMNRNQVRSMPEVLHSKVCYIVFFFNLKRKERTSLPVQWDSECPMLGSWVWSLRKLVF